MDKVTSREIKIALAKSHEGKSFFETEVKTGPTYGNDHLYKFDGLAISKSWAHPCVTGYEIKVSRGDFLQDAKYCCYLPYCNEMYFVVPKGLIEKNEIPTEFGLIYYNPETKALLTKKKAIYRNVEIPSEMLMYLFMNGIQSDRYPFHFDKADFFRDWLEHKNSNRDLGYQVKGRMADLIKEYEDRLASLARNERALDQLKEIDKYLEEAHGKYVWNKDKRLEIIKQIIEKPNSGRLEEIKRNAEFILKSVEKMEGTKGESDESNSNHG